MSNSNNPLGLELYQVDENDPVQVLNTYRRAILEKHAQELADIEKVSQLITNAIVWPEKGIRPGELPNADFRAGFCLTVKQLTGTDPAYSDLISSQLFLNRIVPTLRGMMP